MDVVRYSNWHFVFFFSFRFDNVNAAKEKEKERLVERMCARRRESSEPRKGTKGGDNRRRRPRDIETMVAKQWNCHCKFKLALDRNHVYAYTRECWLFFLSFSFFFFLCAFFSNCFTFHGRWLLLNRLYVYVECTYELIISFFFLTLYISLA